MPELNLEVGGRVFSVVCQPGEEAHLKRAAAMLAGEADLLQSQIGRIPENKMLLMAGLMLADKLTEASHALSSAEERIGQLQGKMRDAELQAEEMAAKALEGKAAVDPAEISAAQQEAEEAKALLGEVAAHLEKLADVIEAE